jgi:threonine-phosphate decarboxylase
MRRFEHGGDIYRYPGAVDFSASLNPLGMPPAARQALVSQVDAFERYPDPACAELVAAIACFEGVREAWVVPTAGATDAFARICTALRPQRALVCAPGYSGYEQALKQVDCAVQVHRLRADEGFQLTEAFAEDLHPGIDLAFIANPNNPTGRCVPRSVLRGILARAQQTGTIVVLDECFVDLSDGEQSNALLDEFRDLVIVKALTKTYALAGLRVGYALSANEALVARLWEAGQPWVVSVPAQLAGVASLRDTAYLQQSLRLIRQERARLRGALEAQGLTVLPSDTNYLLFRGPHGLADALLGRGILIRSCDNFEGLDGRWYRIAVRTAYENGQLIAALGEVLS